MAAALGRPRIGVLALQGDVIEHVQMLRAVGADPTLVRLPRELHDLDGIVLPGGESTTMGKLMRRYELLTPLRALIRDGLATYGTCAGMILLADRVLRSADDQPTIGGMDLTVERNSFGSQVESFETDLNIEEMPGGPFRAVFIRAPRIQAAGPRVDILARLADNTPVAARQGSLLVSAFHPELTSDDRMHRLFLDVCKDNRGRLEQRLLAAQA